MLDYGWDWISWRRSLGTRNDDGSISQSRSAYFKWLLNSFVLRFFTNTALVFDGVLGPPTPRVIDSSGKSMLFELQKAD